MALAGLGSAGPLPPVALRIMTRGVLRGEISVAPALSICDAHHRDLTQNMNWVGLVCSFVVQGLDIKGLARAGPEKRLAEMKITIV